MPGRKTALQIYSDSGAPEGSTDYTTIVLIHGYAWHSGIFAKLLPLAPAHNARIVLVNRRDYPGSAPLTEPELAPLKDAHAALTASDTPKARAALVPYMRDRAREVYDLLVQFVIDNEIPVTRPSEDKGGIIVGGWSFASGWMMALLAHVAEFPVVEVELSKYVRRVIFDDGPFHVMGYPLPEDPYNPLWDPTLGADTTRVFANWVSGYFKHGETADTIERRVPLESPPPTLSTLTDEERDSALYPGPGNPGGSDDLLLLAGIKSDFFIELKDKALYPPAEKSSTPESEDEEETTDAWRDVVVRYLWCDRSVWEMTWTSWKLREELRQAKEANRSMRPLKVVRLRGANHFIHWDKPELALKSFLDIHGEVVE